MSGKFGLEKDGKVRANKFELRLLARGPRPEKNDPRILIRRIGPNVRYTLVHGKQRPTFRMNPCLNNRIARSRKALVGHGIRFMACRAQVKDNFSRQVLINFELHKPASGKRLSSRANSAAYAIAASMCSGFRDG